MSPPPAATDDFPVSQMNLHPLGSVQQQEADGFRGGTDTTPWPYTLPLDWKADPFQSRNWQFRLSSWRIMDVYIHDYVTHQTPQSLTRCAELALDWHRYFMEEHTKLKAQWYDMATGLRASRIAWLLHQHARGNLALSAVNFKKFDAMADAHYTMLAQSTKIALSNHGLFQLFGLEVLCRYWRSGRRTEPTLPFIRTHLEKILALSFTPEGVHMEASPEYHSFVLGTLKRMSQGSVFAQQMQVVLDKATCLEPFLAMPDGHFPALGDTDNSKINLRHSRLRPDTVAQVAGMPTVIKDLSASGYALARSAPAVAQTDAWMLCVSAMAHVKTHKHADELSFVYFHRGQHVFVDPGKYSYNFDEMRDYIKSAQAHNTVSLEARQITPVQIAFTGSQLHAMAVTADKITLSGTAIRPELFTHTRNYDFIPGQRIEIRDQMNKQVEQAFLNRLHIAPDLDIRADGPAVVITLEDRSTIRIRSRTDAPITSMRGEKTPIAGWYSPSYGSVVPCTTLQTRHDEDVVDGGWVIELNP